jgi:hypothetical protein
MNKIIRLLAFCIIAVNFSCNDTELGQPEEKPYFYKLYGGYYNDHINAVKQNQDGSLLIAGYAQNGVEETWGYISKTLPTGMLDWDTTFFNNIDSKAFDVYSVENQNEYRVACSQKYTDDSTFLYLLTLSPEGIITDSVSTKILATEIQNSQIIYQNDGSIRLLSQIIRRDKTTELEFGFLIIHDLSTQGTLEEAFSMELNQEVMGKVLVQYNTEQSIYVSVTVKEKTDGNSTDFTDVRVLFINDNSVIWDNDYGETGMSESCFDLKIVNNAVVIAGNYKNSETAQKIYLLTLDLEGVKISSNIIGVNNIEQDISCTAFAVNDSNNFVFCGDVKTGIGMSDILFFESKQNGDNVRKVIYGSQGASAGESVGKSIHFMSNENAYLMTGEMESINNNDICIFKLNRNGDWIGE